MLEMTEPLSDALINVILDIYMAGHTIRIEQQCGNVIYAPEYH